MNAAKLLNKQHSKNDNTRLEIEIENFGPIASGNIKLKPLTIFMGSNNSGKSYAARLIYSIMNSEHQSMHDMIDDIFTKINNKYKKITKSHSQATTPPSFRIQFNIDYAYENFSDEIRKNFASQLSELIRFKQSACTLKILSGILQSKITISANTLQYSKNNKWSTYVEVDNSNKNRRKLITIKNDVITLRSDIFANFELHQYQLRSRPDIYRRYHKLAPLVYYLPASRYGILQSHQILFTGIVKNALDMGLEGFSIPRIPGVTINFLNNIYTAPPELGPFSEIADDIEKSMLYGKIEFQNDHMPIINYVQNNQTIPLHRTSSLVSEMSSLILYLRHIVRPGSLLVIEEPESHLHPAHQIELARCLVNLVRKGVYVLITTHSPYMVEPIGNYLQASKISNSRREKIQHNKSSFIMINELAVYLFEAKQNTTQIKEVDVSTEDGIDQKQFVSAFESISEHARAIEKHDEHT